MNEIIASISTPLGTGAIGIIRISGENCLNVALGVFHGKNLTQKNIEPRKLYLGDFISGGIKEKCLMVFFSSPNSYTGEDMIEFQVHGGEFLVQSILSEVIKNGARLAENGEFSKRAFLNGKISLDKAEGIIDVIEATSKAELKAGYELMGGRLYNSTQKMQQQLKEIIAMLEVTIDYPEHDDEIREIGKSMDMLNEIDIEIESLLKNTEHGKIIKSGINIALVGKPNVGKSSLLNALLGEERAIVTNVKGTTRDTIKETLIYKGVKLNFIDTAGLRESVDAVEKIGIDKTRQAIKQANIIVFLIDASSLLDDDDNKVYEQVKKDNPLIVVNKHDIKINQKFPYDNMLYLSAKKGENIEKLKEEIYKRAMKEKIDSSAIVLTNKRHIEALNLAKKQITEAIKNIKNASTDIAVFEIRKIWQTLGKITGETENEKIIDEIFSRFCLGK